MQFNKKTVFIALFAILYLAVGLVSTIHAVSFFGLANSPVLGTILAITFEIGQAAVLFNLLTNDSQRKKFMPWALMCILTLVQILGNIFSSYKYLITNSTDDLRYFKEPIFVWTDLPDQQCNVIITYIVGAILPIVALCLTEMVVSYLGTEEAKQEENKQPIITAEDINRVNEKLVKEYEETHIDEQDEKPEYVETQSEDTQSKISPDIEEEVNDFISGIIPQETDNNPVKKDSHFVNI